MVKKTRGREPSYDLKGERRVVFNLEVFDHLLIVLKRRIEEVEKKLGMECDLKTQGTKY